MSDNERESYWNVLDNNKKFRTLMYVWFLGKNESLDNHIEPVRFFDANVDFLKLPEWVQRLESDQANELAKNFLHSDTKKMVKDLKNNGSI